MTINPELKAAALRLADNDNSIMICKYQEQKEDVLLLHVHSGYNGCRFGAQKVLAALVRQQDAELDALRTRLAEREARSEILKKDHESACKIIAQTAQERDRECAELLALRGEANVYAKLSEKFVAIAKIVGMENGFLDTVEKVQALATKSASVDAELAKAQAEVERMRKDSERLNAILSGICWVEPMGANDKYVNVWGERGGLVTTAGHAEHLQSGRAAIDRMIERAAALAPAKEASND